MNGWDEALLIIGMVIATFSMRFPVLMLSARIRMPESVERALRYVPVAVLTAITVPMLLMPQGVLALSFENAHLLAGLAAILAAAMSRHLLLTIVVGMLVFLALRIW